MEDRLKKPARLSGDMMHMSSSILTPIFLKGCRNISDYLCTGSSCLSFIIKASKVGYETDGSVLISTLISMLEVALSGIDIHSESHLLHSSLTCFLVLMFLTWVMMEEE
jgi:hypothetical protein